MKKTGAPLGRHAPLQVGNAQWKGERREQEDSFGWYVSETEKHGILAVLADGMGGLAGGAQAAQAAVDVFLTAFRSSFISSGDPAQILEEIVEQADRALAAIGGSGSTLAALCVQGNKAFWAAAGDSRIYLWRSGRLYQVNEDHNAGMSRLHRRLKQPDAAPLLPTAGDERLTAYLGQGGLMELDHSIKGLSLQNGDCFILCSDGVDRALTPQEWQAELENPPQKAAEALIRRIRRKKYTGQDNCTVLILKWNEEDDL